MAAAAPSASAQSCGDRDSLIEQLGNVHAEHLVAAGMHDDHHLVELWAAEDGSTWTLLLSRADGFTCIMGAGSAWSPYSGGEVIAGVEG